MRVVYNLKKYKIKLSAASFMKNNHRIQTKQNLKKREKVRH